MKMFVFIGVLVLLVLALSACAPRANRFADTRSPDGEVSGFWLGLWHGIISPVTFIVSLFNHRVGIYEVYNNGGWYNFGYMVGMTIILGGGGGGSSRAYSRRDKC